MSYNQGFENGNFGISFSDGLMTKDEQKVISSNGDVVKELKSNYSFVFGNKDPYSIGKNFNSVAVSVAREKNVDVEEVKKTIKILNRSLHR